MPFDAPAIEESESKTDTRELVVTRSRARLKIAVDGRVLARSDRARVVHEQGRLPRHYVPLLDVDTQLLRETGAVVEVPGKGHAQMLDLVIDGRQLHQAAWRWVRPTRETRQLIEHVCFVEDGRLTLFLDDVRVSLLERAGP